jgi:uncharacterized phiE125 gp8 family phage protein
MLKIIEQSTTLVVSLKQAKAFLRIDQDEEDDTIRLMIEAATSLIEQESGLSLLSKVWQKSCAPQKGPHGLAHVSLPYPPLRQVISVFHGPHEDKTTPLKGYIVDQKNSTPCLLLATSFPTVIIHYQAGFGDKPSDIPAPIRQAVLGVVANLYEKRIPDGESPLDDSLKTLLKPYSIKTYVM